MGIASEGSPMIDADFVRIFYNKTSNQFDTEDAFLSKELNCDFVTGGLCADSKVSNSKIVHVLSLRLLSRSAHQTPNFTNPEFQFPQLKVLQSVFFFLFYITSYIGIFVSILIFKTFV